MPVLQALLLHLVIFALFLYNWSAAPKINTPPPPVIVKAKILTLADPVAAKKKAAKDKKAAFDKKRKKQLRKEALKRKKLAKQKAKKKAERAKTARLKKENKRKKEEKRKKLAKQKADKEKKAAAKKKSEEEKRKARELAKLEAERQRQEELERELERERELEFSNALEEETKHLQAEQDAEAAQSYVGLIRERVKQNWHRPLSARNGMQTTLVIHLVPTGEVNNVYMKESSGDAAFDRSAIQAVQRAEKFEELQQLSPSAFDAHFRQFDFKFRPEDLVR